MTFAEQLKGQRQRLGLTQSEVAELLDVSASWVDKAEREIRTPIKITQEGALARLTNRQWINNQIAMINAKEEQAA